MRLRIAARSSQLAQLQAYLVADAVRLAHPGAEIEFQFRESLGDKNLQDPLWKLPEKGVFTEDFYQDLVENRCDLVVHSWKDLPTEDKPKTEIVGTLKRADARDLLLLKATSLGNRSIRILTSSPRREYNLGELLPTILPFETDSIAFQSVRGNVPTRVRKMLSDKNCDGLVLAKAALDRFLQSNWSELSELKEELRRAIQHTHWMVLPLVSDPCAAAQGALAIEICKDRSDLKPIFQALNVIDDFEDVLKEREILAGYGGGCHQKIGVAMLSRPYGKIRILKGKTDAGEILQQRTLLGNVAPKRHRHTTSWSSGQLNTFLTRENIKFKSHWHDGFDAFFVSRAEALTLAPPMGKILWTAGLQTWQKLAKRGLWCNGSAEGLGDTEDPQIESLCGVLRWAKLTHEEALQRNLGVMKSIASYRMVLPQTLPERVLAEIEHADCLYWTSPTHFKFIQKLIPGITNKLHASGPGLTNHFLKAEILSEPSVFLSENDFLAAFRS